MVQECHSEQVYVDPAKTADFQREFANLVCGLVEAQR